MAIAKTGLGGALSRPSLPCRTSPPQGGRSDFSDAGFFPVLPKVGNRCDDSRSPPLWGRWPAGQRGLEGGMIDILSSSRQARIKTLLQPLRVELAADEDEPAFVFLAILPRPLVIALDDHV